MFALDPAGYVQHWLVTGPEIKPHYGGRTESGDMPDEQVQGWRIERPEGIGLDAPGPFGMPWRYHRSGTNIFLEFDGNVPEPSAARMFAAVDLDAAADIEVEARALTGCWANLWINETNLGSFDKGPPKLRLPLHKGRNRFIALLRHGGLRAVHLGIGLQLLNTDGRVRVGLPGADNAVIDFARAESWLRGIEMVGRDCLRAQAPPPLPAKVNANHEGAKRRPPSPASTSPAMGHVDPEAVDWPADRSELTFPSRPSRFHVEIQIREQILDRTFEVPANRPLVQPDPARPVEAHRLDCLNKLIGRSPHDPEYLVDGIARRVLKEPSVYDSERLDRALQRIDQRIDCADFDLAFALRFYRLGAGTEQDRQRIRESALKFRYWQNEPGTRRHGLPQREPSPALPRRPADCRQPLARRRVHQQPA